MIIYTLPDGRQIAGSQPFTLDGIQYPRNWLALASPEDLSDRNITAEDVPPDPPTVDELKAYAAAKRRDLANGSTSVDVGGGRIIPVWTDPESRGSILGLVVAAGMDPNLTAEWKGADGVFYALDASEITALALGMMAYVQACFTTEAAVLAEIIAETITEFAEIDAADWPD